MLGASAGSPDLGYDGLRGLLAGEGVRVSATPSSGLESSPRLVLLDLQHHRDMKYEAQPDLFRRSSGVALIRENS